MTDVVLRPYQQVLMSNIKHGLNNEKLLVQLECGGGKSVIIGVLANELPGRTLILTHRIELLFQNIEFLHRPGALSSKINTLRFDSQIVISMVETLNSRIKKHGIDYAGSFDNIIVDEVHLDYFKKVYSKYDYKRLIGFTATPLSSKKERKKVNGIEYTRNISMADEFNSLVTGPTTRDLIDANYLCQDYNIVLKLPNIDKLKDSDFEEDGYTTASVNEVYANTASYEILYDAYLKYGAGKKTLIFNANSKINKGVYDYFVSKGVNCRLFDSVNKVDDSRNDIVEWFKNEPAGLLINANVFLTGFNEPKIETILFNRKTKSLALYLQAAGRGARITSEIYKDKFTFVDLGQNIEMHGTFSSYRNWDDYFIQDTWKPVKITNLLKTWDCFDCGAINPMSEITCCVCGSLKMQEVAESSGSDKKAKEGELQELVDMPLPKAKHILDYTKSMGKNKAFAFSILEQKIIDLFLHYKVSNRFYNKKKVDFEVRIKQIYTPIYFAIIKSQEIQGKNATLNTQLNRMYSKIEKLYNP